MGARVYLLLDTQDGCSEEVATILRSIPGVISVLEAPRRQELAELATQAVSAVEDLIEEMRLLPAIADLVAVPS